ncbi:MAG: hypothetical protein K5776_09865 [Lachnospiraceae bacterium]|nr:hypothetical protein [Lachnospiraceae bacterium]
MKKEKNILQIVLMVLMGLCSATGIVFIILSMLNPGTRLLTVGLACVVAGQVFNIISLTTRNKNKM